MVEKSLVEKKPEFVFRHRTIRRWKIDKFEFIKGELRIVGEDDRSTFLQLLEQLPTHETVDIIEVDEEAQAKAERPALGQKTIRGTANAEDLLTAEDRQRLAATKSAEADSNTQSGPATGMLSAFKNTTQK